MHKLSILTHISVVFITWKCTKWKGIKVKPWHFFSWNVKSGLRKKNQKKNQTFSKALYGRVCACTKSFFEERCLFVEGLSNFSHKQTKLNKCLSVPQSQEMRTHHPLRIHQSPPPSPPPQVHISLRSGSPPPSSAPPPPIQVHTKLRDKSPPPGSDPLSCPPPKTKPRVHHTVVQVVYTIHRPEREPSLRESPWYVPINISRSRKSISNQNVQIKKIDF